MMAKRKPTPGAQPIHHPAHADEPHRVGQLKREDNVPIIDLIPVQFFFSVEESKPRIWRSM